MRLAARQWREWPPDTWDRVVSGNTSANLKVSAAKQLARLNTTDIAQGVTIHVCRCEGPFDGLNGISHDGHAAVLSALAEIDPAVVLGRIEQSLSQVEDLSTLRSDLRPHLVGALEKIAFHRATFRDAAHLLLRLQPRMSCSRRVPRAATSDDSTRSAQLPEGLAASSRCTWEAPRPTATRGCCS